MRNLAFFRFRVIFPPTFVGDSNIFRFVGAEIKLLPRYSSGLSDKILTLSGYPFMGRSLMLPKITKVAQKCKSSAWTLALDRKK